MIDAPLQLCRADRPRAIRTLLLHGLAGSARNWADFAALAGQDLELHAAELPWSNDGNQAWAEHADPAHWVELAMLGSQPPGTVPDVVIAHSFAATLLLCWLDDPARLRPRAVVLVAPFYRAHPDDFDWPTISYYLNDFHRILEYGVAVRGGGRLGQDRCAEIARLVRLRIGPHGWMRFFESYLRTTRLNPGQLRMPMLIVSGADDIAAPVSDARALARAVPGAQLAIMPGCGHFPMNERPGEFAALVETFLAGLDPSPGTPAAATTALHS